MKRYSAVLFVTILFSACSEYQKVLNKGPVDKQYKMASDYYDAGDYRRAANLFEKVVPQYAGKPQLERIQYMYSDCLFHTKQYESAQYHFNRFIGNFPKSTKIEDATYMAALSFYHLAPKSSLDQAYTEQAMIALQRFIDKYPESERIPEANKYFEELNRRIELKYFNIAKQYYHTEYYKAAIAAFDNFLEDYFGTSLKEDAIYYKFLSAYELGMNSILSKKVDRLKFAITVFEKFKDTFPESEKLKELTDMKDKLLKELQSTNELIAKITNNGL
ncbi:outer membrane protein assembly factor BamD [Flavobacteriaceae bacterium F08102]|nr:outer membrane protein assembly factor BamD [Flavobacteriaceae bacterium F08102]